MTNEEIILNKKQDDKILKGRIISSDDGINKLLQKTQKELGENFLVASIPRLVFAKANYGKDNGFNFLDKMTLTGSEELTYTTEARSLEGELFKTKICYVLHEVGFATDYLYQNNRVLTPSGGIEVKDPEKNFLVYAFSFKNGACTLEENDLQETHDLLNNLTPFRVQVHDGSSYEDQTEPLVLKRDEEITIYNDAGYITKLYQKESAYLFLARMGLDPETLSKHFAIQSEAAKSDPVKYRNLTQFKSDFRGMSSTMVRSRKFNHKSPCIDFATSETRPLFIQEIPKMGFQNLGTISGNVNPNDVRYCQLIAVSKQDVDNYKKD